MDNDSTFSPDFFSSPDDIFSILEALDNGVSNEPVNIPPSDHMKRGALVSQKWSSSSGVQELMEPELQRFSHGTKRKNMCPEVSEGCESLEGPSKMNHVTVERNRRKTMNEHLAILRSLMPCFYVKRGDQASIVGGVIDYITELQQVLQSLEAKKQRKVYSDVLSPRLISSTRSLSPLSPRPSLPISPRTPQSGSPYRHRLPSTTSYLLPVSSMANTNSTPVSPCNSSSHSDTINELVANSKSPIADVEVKFVGANLLLKTVSPRLPGQATKIMSVLEDLSLEILQANINTVDDTMVNSFTIKIGIECKVSAEDLAQHIQLSFSR